MYELIIFKFKIIFWMAGAVLNEAGASHRAKRDRQPAFDDSCVLASIDDALVCFFLFSFVFF